MYCYRDEQDEVFDIKMYDITEIDTVNRTANGIEGNPTAILYIIHDLDPSLATSIVTSGPISRVVMKKWDGYWLFFYVWFFLHFIYMSLLTWYAAERAQRDKTKLDLGISCPRNISEKKITNYYHYVSISVAGLYILIEVLRIIKTIVTPSPAQTKKVTCSTVFYGILGWLHRAVFNPYGNGWFRACFILLSGFLIADVVLVYKVECYDNYMLLCAVVIGWFLTLFFLRCWQRYSFFTLLIQKIILNEMLSFFVILAIEILAFGTAWYMLIQGTVIVEDDMYSNYWKLLISMTRLAVGNGELNDLFSTKYPGLAVTVFIAFVVMTILLMLNALIAVLGQTATELMDFSSGQNAHHKHFLFQRLSIILFIESFIPITFHRAAGKVSAQGSNTKMRQTIKMKSLRSPGSPEKDAEANIEDVKAPERVEREELVPVLPPVPQTGKSRSLEIYKVEREQQQPQMQPRLLNTIREAES